MTSAACDAMLRCSCITSFGPLVVPDVVNVRHGEVGVAASGTEPDGTNRCAGTPAILATSSGRLRPTTTRSAASSSAGSSVRIAGKSTGSNPHSVTSTLARERASRLPTSLARNRVLTWIANAPSRAQAKIAAR